MEFARQRTAGTPNQTTLARRKRDRSRRAIGFSQALLDSLTEHIAVLDPDGTIIAVNRPWREFALENAAPDSHAYIGSNYLRICEAADGPCRPGAMAVAHGIREVLAAHSEVASIEYPCHTSDEQRWFLARVTPLRWDGPPRVVVCHTNITDRKLLELALAEQNELAGQLNAELERANEQLSELALVDALTGLANRRCLDSALESAFNAAGREGLPLSVVIADVDHFKLYNDTFGHPAGDAALRRVAAILRGQIRSRDLVTRYGGEEFALILPATTAEEARRLTERLCRSIAHSSWELRGITASFGVATQAPETPDAVTLLRQADSALYRSKQTGRDRVTHFADAV